MGVVRRRAWLVAAGLAVMTAGCAAGPLTKREMGALGGGALGAGAGAIIGNQTGNKAAGAAIGGGLGVLAGAIIGDQLEAQDQYAGRTDAELQRQQQEIERQRREIEAMQPLRPRGASGGGYDDYDGGY